MLVHKKSRGVLCEIAAMPDDNPEMEAGRARQIARPLKMLSASPESMLENGYEYCDADWWYVKDNSKLARKLICCYPEFEPILDDDGRLVDIINLNLRRYHEQRAKEKASRETQRQRKISEAKERGYRRNYVPHNQPNGLSFLSDIFSEKMNESKGGDK